MRGGDPQKCDSGKLGENKWNCGMIDGNRWIWADMDGYGWIWRGWRAGEGGDVIPHCHDNPALLAFYRVVISRGL